MKNGWKNRKFKIKIVNQRGKIAKDKEIEINKK